MKTFRWLKMAVAMSLLSGMLSGGTGALGQGVVDLSFDQVDVTAFVKIVGEMTGRRFVVDENVVGRITVVAPGVKSAEVYALFVSILESAGCSILRDGEIYRVVKLPERSMPVAPVVGPDDETPAEGIVTKVLRLEHVPASEIRKLLESTIPKGKVGNQIGAIDETNHLLITDTAAGVRRVESIVAQIDRPGLSRMTEVVSLEFAGAEELARQLGLAMSEGESRSDALRRRLSSSTPGATISASGARQPIVVASPHANSLIMVGTPSQLEEMKLIVKKMDVDSPAGRTRLNAIFLKYLAAEDAAKSLNALLSQPRDEKNPSAPVKRQIAIESSPENNALLVDASLGDFDAVKKLVEQLDKLPEQVHIEVVIAQLSVDDGFELGVEMQAVDLPSAVGDTVIQGSSQLGDGLSGILTQAQQGLFPRGLTVGVAHGSYVDGNGNIVNSFPAMVNIDALKRDGRFEVLSKSSLVAQNNKEASVNIVDEIPVLKSTIEGGSGTSRDVIQNIERVDVGIKLTLKPHIVPGGEVQMELNPSIEAVSDPGSSDTQFTPTIAKREASTTVTVPDSETIVIAGLTREDKSDIVRKVPLLGSIPVLGALFRHTVQTTKKTDVLIFVTPRIVKETTNEDDVMAAWREKTGADDSDSD